MNESNDSPPSGGEDIKPTEWNHPASIGLYVLAMLLLIGLAFVPDEPAQDASGE